jgi:hypothetical protein
VKFKDYLQEKEKQRARQHFLSFRKGGLEQWNADQIRHLMEFFHGYTLMQLPQSEIDFFEWLKSADRDVWNDLWEGEENQYLVSIDLLEKLSGPSAQFPLCDLVDTPNYWFSAKHIKPAGTEAMLQIAAKAETELELEERLLLAIAEADTDIWHYGYAHHVALDVLKKAVEEMVFRGWIVHLPDREDLVKYIQI